MELHLEPKAAITGKAFKPAEKVGKTRFLKAFAAKLKEFSANDESDAIVRKLIEKKRIFEVYSLCSSLSCTGRFQNVLLR